jgi:hypothetical protein
VAEPAIGQHSYPFLECNRQLIEVLGEIDTGNRSMGSGSDTIVDGIGHHFPALTKEKAD